jgi:threonine/homoserine/homoserine lactone efflux protein
MSVSTEFLATALVVVLVPGTGVIYTVSTDLFAGRRASLFAALGGTVGIAPHLAAAILGLSAIVHQSAEVFQLLKYAGVAYLLYLAWGMWRSTGALALHAPAGSRSGISVVGRGVLINLLNPKLTIFFFAFLPQFITSGSSETGQMAGLGAIFMAITLVVFVVYGALASKVRDRVVRSSTAMQRLQRGFAGLFAALGFRLALQER